MAYSADRKPGELTALTVLATDDVFVVGDTSDASEVAKYITKANLITDLTTSFAPALGANDNYVTDAEKTVIGNTSGTNSGDNAVNTLYSGLVTNATHTGEVTGSGALTLDKTAVSNKTDTIITATDVILFSDASDSGNLKSDTVQGILDLMPGGGNVSKVGTPVDNQIGVWTGDGTIEGDANLTFDTATDTLTTVNVSATTFTGALTGTASGNLTSGGALGTPSSGTLTNCSGLPATGLVADTTTAVGVGSINLGHASDTTISRTGAGAIAVEGVGVALNSISLAHTASTIELGHASDTTIARVSAGIASIEGNNIITANRTASDTVTGVVELAIASELNTGTDATRAVTPDSLAGSNLGIRYVSVGLNGTTALTTSEKAYFRIPAALTGMNLVSVSASVGTGAAGSSSSGTPTFTVKNVTDANQMLSTSLTVDASEYTSATAATPAVINGSFDDVVTDDLIEVAVTTSGTGVTYAVVTMGFQLP